MALTRGFAPSLGAVAVALGVAAMGPLLWWLTLPQQPVAPAAAPLPVSTVLATVQAANPAASPHVAEPDVVHARSATPPAVALPGPSARAPEPGSDPSLTLADVVNPGEAPSMAEVISRLHAAGVRSGLGAFQPPGTRPPLVGLAVPEDFVLPPGYVRHHQATDDGQRIEAVLMFAPDAQLLDGAGQALPLPADRVVPPELAPPGLPLRRIVVPAPAPPGR